MAQAGFTPIQLYFSTTASAVPTSGNLANGELAINIVDEKLYFKNSAGTVKLLASNATSAPVTTFSAGTTGFTPNTATSGAITLAGTLATTNGGTGLTSFTANGVVYASSSSALATGSALTFDGTTLVSPVFQATTTNAFKTNSSSGQYYHFDNASGNNFMGLSALNKITLYAGGAENVNFTSTSLYTASGINVGIGTSNPQDTLHVVGRSRLSITGTNDHQLNAATALEVRGPAIPSGGTTKDYFKGFKLALNDGAEYGGQAQFALGRWEESSTDARSSLVISLGNGAINSQTDADVDVMTLLSNGNVGIGTTSPSFRLHAVSSSAVVSRIGSSGGSGAFINFIDSGASPSVAPSVGAIGNSLVFMGDGSSTERARIDSSGNLLINTTSPLIDSGRRLSVVGGSVAGSFKVAGASDIVVEMWNAATSGNNIFSEFKTEASPTFRGSITYNRAGGLTVYNTTSDYRAKDIYGVISDSGSVIDSVPVYMGKMKDATQERPMFIAHETPSYAHTGEKDAVDSDGNPVYQQMDASALIPVMWAEIQSLRKRLADAGIA